MKMKNFELQLVENLGSTMDSIGVDHSNRGQLYSKVPNRRTHPISTYKLS